MAKGGWWKTSNFPAETGNESDFDDREEEEERRRRQVLVQLHRDLEP